MTAGHQALFLAVFALPACASTSDDTTRSPEATTETAREVIDKTEGDPTMASDFDPREASPGPAASDPSPGLHVPRLVISRFGSSVAGRPIEARTIGDTALPAVLFLSTIHGNEWAGTPLLKKLETHLLRRPELLRTHHAVIVPVLNPDGYAANRRTNDHGVDLNRNFPAENFEPGGGHGSGPLSEPESAALHQLIADRKPVRIISMHQPYGVMDFDGPGESLAYTMSAVCDLPVRRVGSRKGSLGSWVGLDLRLPIITVEFRGRDHQLSAEELWSRYGAMLLVCLRDNYPR